MKTLLLALAITLSVYAQVGEPVAITPYQVFDARTGQALPCVGCSIYTYAAGTTTPLATFTDGTLTTANTNPVLTNSSGYAVNGSTITGIWVGAACYKFVLKDSLGVALWTQDNVCGLAIANQVILTTSNGAGLVGFSQSATYPAGSIGQKLQGSASPIDAPFNALCDGTTDDSVALQQWLSSGPNLYLPKGVTCITAAGLTTTISNQVITGAGTIKAKSAGFGGAALLTVNNIHMDISGITLNGNSSAPRVLELYCANGSTFNKITVTGSTSDGILFSSSVGIGGDCPTLNTGNNNAVTFINADIFGNGAAGTGSGVVTTTGDTQDNNISFINCNVDSNGHLGYRATANNWEIFGGYIFNNYDYGIDFESGGGHIVQGAFFSGNSEQGSGTPTVAQAKDVSANSLWLLPNQSSSSCYTNSNTCTVFMGGQSIAMGMNGSLNWFVQGGNILSGKSSAGGTFVVDSVGNVTASGTLNGGATPSSLKLSLSGAADGYLELSYPDTMSHTTMLSLSPVNDGGVHSQIPTFAAIGQNSFGGITSSVGAANVPLDSNSNPVPCNAFLPTSNHDPIGTLYQMMNVSDDSAAVGASYVSGGSKHAILACMGSAWIVMVKEP